MTRQAIPEQIRQAADAVIQDFNTRVIGDPERFFTARYRGNYLYLDRCAYGPAHPRCRLTYTGPGDRWEFAIYKYSDECYDPTEWFFPGAQYVDGTVAGALRAALDAYP
jgi:hypothetical protein